MNPLVPFIALPADGHGAEEVEVVSWDFGGASGEQRLFLVEGRWLLETRTMIEDGVALAPDEPFPAGLVAELLRCNGESYHHMVEFKPSRCERAHLSFLPWGMKE